jgi:hypothetical protein
MAILPFIEQGNVWNLYNDRHPAYYEGSSGTAVAGWPQWNALSAANNIAAQSTVINVFSCPSTPIPAAERVYDRTTGSGATARISRESASDYAVSNGVNSGTLCTAIGGERHNNFGQVNTAVITNVSFGSGVVDWNRPLITGSNTSRRRRIQDISDGTAYTVAVYERAGGPKAFYGRKIMSTEDETFFIAQAGSGSPSQPGAPAIQPATSASLVAGSFGFNDPDFSAGMLTGSRTDGLTVVTSGTNFASGASCPVNCSNRGNTMGGWYSFHDGGAHILLGDGTVRFVQDTIGRLPWCYLMTSQGYENVEF